MRGEPPAPPVTDLRALVLALGAAVGRALPRELGLRCEVGVPRIDGSLYFPLTRAGEPAGTLDWLAGDDDATAAGGRLVAHGVPAAVARAARPALAAFLEQPGHEVLAFHNLEHEELVFDEHVAEVLLGERIVPGRLRWYDYRLEDVRTRFEDVEVRFGSPAGAVRFVIAPPGRPGPTLLATSAFALILEHDPRPAALRQLLPHQIERILGFLLSRAVPPGVPGRRGAGRGAPVSTTRWGDPDQWRRFFSDFEIERSGTCGLRFLDPHVQVLHGELECRYVAPDRPHPVSYAAYPWRLAYAPAPGSRQHLSLIRERESICGGTEQLAALMDRLAAERGPRFVVVNNTCVPKVVGDDVPSIVARARAAGLRVLNLNTDLASPDEAFRDLFLQAAAALGPPGERDRNLVNLVGFVPDRSLEELVGLLARLGLRVGARPVPAVHLEELGRYARAATQVFYPHAAWAPIYDRVFAPLPLASVRADAPFGPRRTAAWLRAVATASGRDAAGATLLGELEAAHAPALARLAEAASPHRLAFVVDEEQLYRFEDPARFYGVPILPFLEELGFGLDLLVHRRRPGPSEVPLGAAPAALQRVAATLAAPARHRAHFFPSPPALRRLLASDAFAAVYSEVFLDTRLTRAGKPSFNLTFLEKGFAGAARTAARLIALCRWRFYARYAPWLGAGPQQELTPEVTRG